MRKRIRGTDYSSLFLIDQRDSKPILEGDHHVLYRIWTPQYLLWRSERFTNNLILGR